MHTCSVTQACPTLATPRTVARHAPLSMGFSKQEDWSGLLFPPPGDLPHSGVEPGSPALQADSLLLSHPGSPAVQLLSFPNFNVLLSLCNIALSLSFNHSKAK